MKCEHCPVKLACPDAICIAERFNAVNLCKKLDPDSPDYNSHHATLIADKSCGTNNYSSASVSKECSEDVKMEQPKEEKQFPSTWQQLKNFARTGVEYVKDGMKNVSQEEYDQRMAICNDCDQLDKNSGRCYGCGCVMKNKSWLRVAKCPLSKWSGINTEIDNSA